MFSYRRRLLAMASHARSRSAAAEAASRGRMSRQSGIERLEARQMLTADATHVVNLQYATNPFDDFGRFEREVAKAADLSRYTAAELATVHQWMVIKPEYLAWRASGFGHLPSATNTTNGGVATVVQPMSANDSTGIGTVAGGTLGGAMTTTFTTQAAIKPLEVFRGAEVWEFPIDVSWQTAAAEIDAADVGSFYPLVAKEKQKKFIPNDPYFGDQWHLRNRAQTNGLSGQDANVVPAWDTVRGTGVLIGIVDDGVDYLHPDLLNAYRQDLDGDYVDGDLDAYPNVLLEDFHGTSVAGVAGARGNNGIGVSGAAPNASITGIRLLGSNQDDNTESSALTHQVGDVDIYNNSWGPDDGVDYLLAPGPLTSDALIFGTAFGRGGLGSIYTFAAGNGRQDGDDANYDGYVNSVWVMAVTAIDDRGKQSAYAEPGAPILISGYSSSVSNGLADGIVTTDITGNKGYNYVASAADDDPFPDMNYTGTFGGTSSAAPLVSGVVALMLEANPNLSWRDVRAILVESARKNDPTDPDWKVNGAGYDINHKYGFGAVDANAAVQLARTWTTLGAGFQTSTGQIFSGQQIPENNSGISVTTFVTDNLVNIEYVEVTVTTNHDYAGDLEIVLTSPAGTKSTLATRHDDGTNYDAWRFGTVRHWGENTQGEWKLTVYDRDAGVVGTLDSFEITFYTGPDRAPVATTDTAQARPTVPVDIDVLSNDAGRPDPTTVVIVTPPSVGTASVLPSGQIRYTAPAGFNGTATLRYTVASQGGLVSNAATVNIIVNEPPVARADTVTTPEDTPGNFNVATNDTDVDGTVVASTVEIVVAPQHGTASVDLSGRIVYTPELNYNGADTLQYRIADDDGGVSGSALVTISVTPVNDPPTVVDDTAKAVGGVPSVVAVLANDFDIDSSISASTVTVVTPPPSGTAVANPDGTITVTPGLGFAGLMTFTYSVRDTQGAQSLPATVRVSTAAPPSTIGDSVNIDEDQTVVIDVLANDFDVDGTIVRSTLAVAVAPAHGTATVDSSTQRIRYVPAANYFGTDTFRYTVRDNEGNTSAPGVVTINLREVNDAPVGKVDAAGTNPGIPVTIDVVANDIDVDGTVMRGTVNIPTGGRPAHGSAAVNLVTGDITYMPTPGYVGSDALTYFVRDEDGALSNETTVLLRVGRPVELSGIVYADVNNNGQFDAGEIGVGNTEVSAIMAQGLFNLKASVRTEDDGTFVILDRPNEGVVLPQGTYSLVQSQPAAFVDGVDVPGTPAPAAITDDRFIGITLAAGESATDFEFAERGLRAQFVTSYLNRRLYFASAAAGSLFGTRRGRVFDLEQGEVVFSFDEGTTGRVTASATFDAASGNVRLDVLDANLNVLSSANSSNGSVAVQFGPGAGPYFLRLTGTADNVLVSATAPTDAVARTGATMSLGGSLWSGDMRDQFASQGQNGGLPLIANELGSQPIVPWTNVDTISVRFDSAVSIGQSGLRLATASGDTYTVTRYVYDFVSRTGTWTLDRPLGRDNYLAEITPITGAVNLGSSASAPQQLRFSVVPGDVDGDGATSYLDVIAIRNRMAEATSYALSGPRFDLDGNGAVNDADWLAAVRGSFRGRLADEVSALLLSGGGNGSTSGGSPDAAAAAVVRRATNRTPVVAASPVAPVRSSRAGSSQGTLTASTVDAAFGGSGGTSMSSLRARRSSSVGNRAAIDSSRDDSL